MFMSVILSLPSLSFLYYIVSFFCEAIQYFRVYLSSSFLFTLLFVLIFWTVPKVYCTYWLTLHWYFMLEGNENLFINRIHINHCICKEKYAYRQKFVIFTCFWVSYQQQENICCRMFLQLETGYYRKILFFYECRLVLYLRFLFGFGESKHRFSERKIYSQFQILWGRSKSNTPSSTRSVGKIFLYLQL